MLCQISAPHISVIPVPGSVPYTVHLYYLFSFLISFFSFIRCNWYCSMSPCTYKWFFKNNFSLRVFFFVNNIIFLRRGQYSTITLAVYGRLSEGTPDPLLGRPAAVSSKKPASLPGTDFRVKEEPVRPPESPLPDGNARNGGWFPDIFLLTFHVLEGDSELRIFPSLVGFATGSWSRLSFHTKMLTLYLFFSLKS